MDTPSPESDLSLKPATVGYVRWFAAVAAFIAVLPHLLALLFAQPGHQYIGAQFSTDDHMVYAAWMRQAMDGHFLFDNRFAVDPQPGITVNVFFFLLGLLAKVVTIPWASTMARAGFSALFIVLLARLVRPLTPNSAVGKLTLTLSMLGGGVGYVVWHTFGRDIVRPELVRTFGAIMGGHLPTDVWQPEGYVMSSMLTSSLFMASLCLIVFVFICILETKDSWKPVLGGSLSMAVLMNMHSYDVLMIALVAVAFLAASTVRKQITWAWVIRAACIGAGAVLPSLWFIHVLRTDAVFQLRAATPTFSPTFRQVLFGYLPLIILAFLAIAKREGGQKKLLGSGALALMLLGGFTLGNGNPDAYWMSLGAWVALMIAAVGVVCLLADDDPVWNLIVAWAAIGTFAPYFPALFQRKLAMGLEIPWAVLASLGLYALVSTHKGRSKLLITGVGVLACSASSLLWLIREAELARSDVSNTLTHPVYIGADTQKIIEHLQPDSSKHTVVLAMPGIRSPILEMDGSPLPDAFNTPFIPDLNPIVAGFAGVYSYAGHWSETPDYGRRHDDSLRFFLPTTKDGFRRELIKRVKPDFIVAPMPKTFPGVADVSSMGQVVVPGDQFELIKVRPVG